jgi:hypothetical protein
MGQIQSAEKERLDILVVRKAGVTMNFTETKPSIFAPFFSNPRLGK